MIGGYGSSGMVWVPERPKPGFQSINVVCAQDESLWDHSEDAEYAFGWSENFGTGPDGERLWYVSGEILESTRERVALWSVNRGGCYEFEKLAVTQAGERFWVIGTRITNRCPYPVSFDFFSGDDPWLGTYRSSDGDVGWTPTGLVRTETSFELGEFTAGGLFDLGNLALGQAEGSFSNQANFIALDPGLPLPDQAHFANRFAHHHLEIDPRRPLDNQTLTALNLGWTEQSLPPEASFEVAYALGLAVTGDESTLPRLPELTSTHFSRLRQLREPKAGAIRDNIVFAAELVELRLTPGELAVRGTYQLENPSAASATFTLGFPITVSSERPAPLSIRVDGQEVSVVRESETRVSARFVQSLPPRALHSFTVEYTQRHTGRHAEYVVTSARAWGRPLKRAVFRIVSAPELGPIEASYPGRSRLREDGWRELVLVEQPFAPDRELTLSW